jgi:Secretion system C-terminal sorting domain
MADSMVKLKTFKKMKIIITLFFVFVEFISFSQQITSKNNLTANNPILSHEALMDKILKRVPKKVINTEKLWQGNTKAFPFQKSAKLMAPSAYCNCQAPLAVREIELTATRPDAQNVKVNWKTTGEQNSQGFDIERSIDATKFLKLGFIAAKNTTEGKSEYTWLDANSYEGLSYYRIKEIDLNNMATYSKIVAVQNFSNEAEFKIFPNPASEFVNLQIYAKKSETAELTVLSMTGQQISQQKMDITEGANTAKIQMVEQPPGIYFLRILTVEKVKIIKFSKN